MSIPGESAIVERQSGKDLRKYLNRDPIIFEPFDTENSLGPCRKQEVNLLERI